MPIGFVSRRSCPLCLAEAAARPVCELAFDAPPLAGFLRSFYAGRLEPEFLGDAVYRVVECDCCGFLYQQNILNTEGMQALYEEWIDSEASLCKKQTAGPGLERRYTRQVETLARMIGATARPPRLLDFGMGWGYWGRVAQDLGFEVSGFELSAGRRAHARSMGLSVIEELPPPGAYYDCIFAGQVFEHLADPRRSLETLGSRLVAGGLVYLRVPDGRGVAEKLRRHGWSPDLEAVHPLEHINCFTRKSLIALADCAGLEPVSPPIRLELGSLPGSLRREFVDRFLTTHVHFRLRD